MRSLGKRLGVEYEKLDAGQGGVKVQSKVMVEKSQIVHGDYEHVEQATNYYGSRRVNGNGNLNGTTDVGMQQQSNGHKKGHIVADSNEDITVTSGIRDSPSRSGAARRNRKKD